MTDERVGCDGYRKRHGGINTYWKTEPSIRWEWCVAKLGNRLDSYLKRFTTAYPNADYPSVLSDPN